MRDKNKILWHANGGFTLLEILISLGIIALLGSFSIVSILNSRRIRDLNAETQNILSVLRTAQSKTLAGEAGESWGVHLENAKYVLFPAHNPYNQATASNTIYLLPSTLEIENINLNGAGSEIIFQRVSGKTSTYGTLQILVKSGTDSSLVTINDSGAVYSGGAVQNPLGTRVIDTRHRNFNLGWSIQNTNTLKLTFSDPPNTDVVLSVNTAPYFNADKSKFDWSGTQDVYGQPQNLRIHTVYLSPSNATLSIDRDRGLNNKKIKIEIDSKHIATYEADGTLTVGQYGGAAQEP